MYQIGLTSSYRFTNDCKMILDDYSWWVSLVKRICKEADQFEIRCWTGETDAIDTGMRYGNSVDNTTTDEHVYKGRITDEFQNEIIRNYLTENNCLKWFTLNLYRDETLLFLSEHYGSEVHLLHVKIDEIPSMKSWIEQFSSVKILHIDTMNEDEIEEDEIDKDNIDK